VHILKRNTNTLDERKGNQLESRREEGKSFLFEEVTKVGGGIPRLAKKSGKEHQAMPKHGETERKKGGKGIETAKTSITKEERADASSKLSGTERKTNPCGERRKGRGRQKDRGPDAGGA